MGGADANAPRRGWRLLRKLVTWATRGLLLTAILLEGAYLARRPLFESFLCAQAGRLLGPALGGTVRVGGIAGDWVSRITVTGVEIETPGLLREVRGAAIDVDLDALRLGMGDLSGLRRVRLRAAALTLDLTAPGGPAAPPEPPGAPVDLGEFAMSLPGGAQVDVDALRVIGVDARVEGPARVRLAPARGGDARLALVHAPGLVASATLDTTGTIRAAFGVRDVSRIPRLFAALDGLRDGAASGRAALALAPAFACDADVVVRGLRAADQGVAELSARARIDAAGLRGLDVALSAPGLRLEVADAGFSFADVAGSLRGRALADVRGLEPYAALLPEVVRAQLPIEGWLQVDARGGLLHVDDGRIRTAGAAIDLDGGAFALGAASGIDAGAPLRFVLHLRDASTLPLGGSPVRPIRGAVAGVLSQTSTALVLDTRLDVDLVDDAGRSGAATGTVRVEIGDQITLVPDVRARGAFLRELGPTTTLGGRLVVSSGALRFDGLRIDLGDRPALTVDGDMPLAATPATILRAADLGVVVHSLPIWPLLRAAGDAEAQGELDGTLSCRGGAVDADLRAALSGLAAAKGVPVAVTVALAADASGVRVRDVRVRSDAGDLQLRGEIRGGDALGWLDTAPALASLQTDFSAELAVPDFQRFALAPLLGIEMTGGAQAKVAVRGTAAAPMATATVALDDLGITDRGGNAILRGGTGTLALDGERLSVHELGGTFYGHALTLSCEAMRADAGVAIASLRLADDHGGALTLQGSLPGLFGRGWQEAVTAANLDLRLLDYSLEPWLALAGLDAEQARAAGTLALRPGPTLELDLTAGAERLLVDGHALAPQLQLGVRAGADSTQLTSFALSAGSTRVTGSGSVAVTPAALLADPAAIAAAELAISLRASETDLAALPAAMLGLAELRGRLNLDAEISGTAAAPQLRATFTLAGATVVSAGGQRIDDLEARITCTPDSVTIDQLTCTRGKGPLQVSGTFTAPGPLWERWGDGELDLRAKGDNVLLHRRAGMKVRADFDVRAHGPLSDFVIEGDVGLRDGKMLARLPLLDLRSSGGRAATEGIPIPSFDLGPGRRGRLDLRVKTLDAFQVRNNVLDGDLHAQIAIRGDLAQPVVQGTVSGPDSTVILPGVRLRASTLLVEFTADNPRFPQITVTARGRRHGFDIHCVVRGRYDRPEIIFHSDPPLPSDELIVLVTTGARPQTLGGAQGVGTVLGTYLAQELADWIFGSESTEAKEGFLDRFTVETGTEMSRGGTESVVVEFRVLDRLYLQGERDVYEDLNMGVVYRLRFK